MELFTKSQGLQHIAEDIFHILDKKCLLDCKLVNKSWMSIMNRQTFWLKHGLKKLISEVELIIDLIFGKLEQQAVLDNEQSFKSWEMLVEEIEEDQTYENFTNLLIKMFYQTQTNVSYGNYCRQYKIYIEYFYKNIFIFFSENGPK